MGGVKRTFDLIVTLLAAPFWLPLFLLVAILTRLMMGPKVFFRQERAGAGGTPFSILKFRTMREGPGTDAERTPGFGRVLRATSLDELPQLFHVLSGKMSLVGPRPLPTAYLTRYSPREARRHEVRPGITGWAQVNGRNAISWRERLELDVWYVEHRSLALDLEILARTVLAVASRRGVNAAEGETMSEFTGTGDTPEA